MIWSVDFCFFFNFFGSGKCLKHLLLCLLSTLELVAVEFVVICDVMNFEEF